MSIFPLSKISIFSRDRTAISCLKTNALSAGA